MMNADNEQTMNSRNSLEERKLKKLKNRKFMKSNLDHAQPFWC